MSGGCGPSYRGTGSMEGPCDGERRPTEMEVAFAFSHGCTWGSDPRLDWVRRWVEKHGWPRD